MNYFANELLAIFSELTIPNQIRLIERAESLLEMQYEDLKRGVFYIKKTMLFLLHLMSQGDFMIGSVLKKLCEEKMLRKTRWVLAFV